MFCINCGKEIPNNLINFCPTCGHSISKDAKFLSQILNYITNRLDEQTKWHSEKARENKKKFRFYEIITIISGASIPLINIIGFSDLTTRIITSVVGGLISVITGITQLEKYQENWIIYRTTAELLKKEKHFYENSIGEYDTANIAEKNKKLVERIESIVSSETSKYFSLHQPKKTESQRGQINTNND
jgi:hypothetical protein